MLTFFWVAGSVVVMFLVWFTYMTLARNAEANRQDLLDSAPPIGDDASVFLGALHGAAGERSTPGNQVDVLINGVEIFPALVAAIRNAQQAVHFVTYVWWEGRQIPPQFADLFSETARRGVTVRIVIDSEGSESMMPEHLEQMREAGCIVATFRSVKWNTWMRYNHRSHRRLLIVDGEVGFTGGVGIADEWSGDAANPKEWRDTHIRVTGPAVASLQAGFADTWNRATNELLLAQRDYPRVQHEGSMEASVIVSTPVSGSSSAQRTMAAVIAGATKTLHITNAYFVPTPAFIKNLCDASRRGVDVKVIVPGPYHDMPAVRYASWHVWATLLRAGIEIYEYQPSMIHCKTLVVDGVIGLVGSINFDPRSFALNLEAAVIVSDAGVAERLERAFDNDKSRSKRIELADIQAQGFPALARNAACYWVRAQL